MKVQGKIFIVVSIILLLILISWAIIKLAGQNKTKSGEKTQDERVFNRSVTIGADKIVTEKQVKDSFKDLAKDFSKPEVSGVLVAQKDSLGEGVKYGMTMTKNNVAASIHINKFTYEKEEDLKKNIPIIEGQGTSIKDLGDSARFYMFAPVAADWRAALMVIKGKSIYVFTLLQNYNEGIGITETAAKEALIKLAKQAKFEDIAKSKK
ncbi:MAG: hypothetical protein ACFNUB_03615 [Candidatus Saccharibacteria bacterium]|nr:hypothetical protein [Candidatus Saccharibacteria bacterium]